MSILSEPRFHDPIAALEHVEKLLWPNGPSARIAARGSHLRHEGQEHEPACGSAATAASSSP